MATLNPTYTTGGVRAVTPTVPAIPSTTVAVCVALASDWWLRSLPIAMLFVSFTSAYIVRQGLPTLDERTSTYVRDWIPVNLPVALLLVNTFLLVASSVTMELARRQMARSATLTGLRSVPGVSFDEGRAFPWLHVTVALGIGFLAGQWLAWRELASRGFYLATNASSSFVYLLTASHAVHLAGGLLALLYALAASLRAKAFGVAIHRGRYRRLVLAFHGRAVDLHLCAAAVRSIAHKEIRSDV